MLDFITAPENLPFSVALLLMLMIAAVEAVGLGAGAADLGADADGDVGGLLGWLGVGEVPLLILLVVLLAWFAMIGVAVQQFVGPFPLWIASGAALAGALPLTGISARKLARILPGDETTAISLHSLIGRRATVSIGVARTGSPARAQVRDIHGQTHHVMIEPNAEGQAISAGETVLLVRREGNVFIGLAEGDALLPRLDERPQLIP
jgi:hypothetical protein